MFPETLPNALGNVRDQRPDAMRWMLMSVNGTENELN